MRELEDFLGNWVLERRIKDRKTGDTAKFIGKACIAPAAQGAKYTETGVLTIGGSSVEAVRVYRWDVEDEGSISIYFEDGRFFHKIDPGECPAAAHDCAPDVYKGEYDFGQWPIWRLTWHVSGPRKDYTSVTVFRPDAA